MKLNYNILWFEDDKDIIYETQGPPIQDFLVSLGFIPKIDHRANGKSLPNLIQTGDINKYDLILSDLNLGDGNETGRKLIDHIRDAQIFTEVLLYSADDVELEAVIKESGWVERASFCVGADDQLRDKLKVVTRLSVNKQQDVNNTRGLFIAETIVLEKKIENILLDFFKVAEGTALGPDRIEILEKIRAKKLKYNQNHISILEQVPAASLEKLIDEGIVTASNTLEALQGIFKKQIKEFNKTLATKEILPEAKLRLSSKKEQAAGFKAELENFQAEIIAIRNTLAHVEESTDEDGTPILVSRMRNAPAVRLTSPQYVKMRRDIQKHSQNLEDIIKHLAEQA
jgi:CheY-like chemotaxis protein